MNLIKQKFENNKKTVFYCLAVTFIIGLAAHAYMYFQDSFSHDGLNEFNGNLFNKWKIQLGRFVVPLYRLLTRGGLALPWIIGILSLLWIALSVFLTVKMFNIKSKGVMALISAIYTVNVTVTTTAATYIHDLDANMFALLLSVLAVYLWQKYKFGFIPASLCIGIFLGLYQSYMSVAITLAIILLVTKLLNGEDFKSVFISGLKAVAMLLAGGILYMIGLKIVLTCLNIEAVSGSYNTLDNMFSMGIMEFIKSTIETYRFTITCILHPQNSFGSAFIEIITKILAVIAFVSVCFKVFGKNIKIKEKILTIILLAIIPLTANISKILAGGMSHDLMHFGIWLLYLLAIVAVYDPSSESKIKKIGFSICSVILSIILIGNIIWANEVYLKKDFEQDAALSYFTRLVDRMDNFEGFDPNENTVIFIGKPDIDNEQIPSFADINGVGLTGSYVIGAAYPSYYKSYFEHKLNYKIRTDYDTLYVDNQDVIDMPAFPDEGCLQMIDDVLIVKLGQ